MEEICDLSDVGPTRWMELVICQMCAEAFESSPWGVPADVEKNLQATVILSDIRYGHFSATSQMNSIAA